MGFFLVLLLLVLVCGNVVLTIPEKSQVSKQFEVDKSKCHIKSSCNPVDPTPCGCIHACCAPDVGLHDNYEGHARNGALPFLYGYRCYKKPRVGEICSRDGLCPCADNLKCVRMLSGSKIRRCY